jgi:hypothetical protein
VNKNPIFPSSFFQSRISSLTDEMESPNSEMSAEAKEIDCLFELCKEDFPFITSQPQIINIGKFLHVSLI